VIPKTPGPAAKDGAGFELFFKGATETIMKRLLFTIAGIMLLGSTQVTAITLGFDPASQVANTGDTVSLDLVASGLTSGGSDSIGGFDVDVLFDDSVLGFVGGTTGTGLGSISDFYFASGGVVDAFAVSLELPADLDALQGSTVVLATLAFEVLDLAPGTSTTVAIDSSDQFLLVSDAASAAPLPITALDNGTIRAPAPGVLALLSIGLAALGYARCRVAG
jgi:hypothetical protein